MVTYSGTSTAGNIPAYTDANGDEITDSGVSAAGVAIGAASSTANNLVKFSGTDGKTLEDSGLSLSSILLAAHPVGSYYWSDVNTSPASLFGGTWAQVKDVFILAAGDTYTAGATGGAATVTLAQTHIPYYNLLYDYGITPGGSTDGIVLGTKTGSGATMPSAGGGQAFSIMPPYRVAYCWRRTA